MTSAFGALAPLGVLGACGSGATTPQPFEPADASVFTGHDGRLSVVPFDVVAVDMDLDGDDDVLVNRHHRVELELFENTGARFELVNPRGADRSGLFDNPGIPTVYADEQAMLARIEDDGREGVFVWHDVDRSGMWRFRVVGAAPACVLELSANRPIEETDGLDDVATERGEGPFALRVPLGAPLDERCFGVRVAQIATQLVVRVDGATSSFPVLVGPDLVERSERDVSLWKPDPHGVAWVQAESTPEPELLVVRGGLRGLLAPPHPPKEDQLFVWRGARDALYAAADAGVIPADYGRGREVQWVDADGDGRCEPYLGNEETPNRLLFRDARGAYVDRAPELGLDFEDGEAFAWFDVDRDGDDDLVAWSAGVLVVARNEGGAFATVAGSELGFVLPPAEPVDGIFSVLALHVFDLDGDGALDLWVSGHGKARTNHLFLARGGRFADATSASGLDALDRTNAVAHLDADGDGRVDAIALRQKRVVLLRNVGDARFEERSLEALVTDPSVAALTVCDANGDARPDVVLVGEERSLLRNAGADDTGALSVTFEASADPPIGTLVVARYADGSAQAQRYGSSSNSAFSQTLQPLRFGFARANPITEVEVRRLGRRDVERYPIDRGAEDERGVTRLTLPASAAR